MRILVLSANQAKRYPEFEAGIAGLEAELAKRGHETTRINLEGLDFRACTGCFACWVKTPGVCVFDDGFDAVLAARLASDLVVLSSPLEMGYLNSLAKASQERILPLMLPYLADAGGYLGHPRRYGPLAAMGLLLHPEADTDAEDLAVVQGVFSHSVASGKIPSATLALSTQTPKEAADALLGA